MYNEKKGKKYFFCIMSHLLRFRIVACSVPSHYLNQSRFIINCPILIKFEPKYDNIHTNQMHLQMFVKLPPYFLGYNGCTGSKNTRYTRRLPCRHSQISCLLVLSESQPRGRYPYLLVHLWHEKENMVMFYNIFSFMWDFFVSRDR